MLAQNFKTPTDLKITNAEFDALVKVLGMLEREELLPSEAGASPLDIPLGRGALWMRGYLAEGKKSGTLACIAGWAHLASGRTIFQFVDFGSGYPSGNNGLHELFTAGGRYNRQNIYPPQAAIALRNYLTHGEPRWAEAFAA